MNVSANGADATDGAKASAAAAAEDEERCKDVDDEDGDDDDDENDDSEKETADLGALGKMLDNLDEFVLEPAPQDVVVKCRITRDRKGMDRGEFSPVTPSCACPDQELQFKTSKVQIKLIGFGPRPTPLRSDLF